MRLHPLTKTCSSAVPFKLCLCLVYSPLPQEAWASILQSALGTILFWCNNCGDSFLSQTVDTVHQHTKFCTMLFTLLDKGLSWKWPSTNISILYSTILVWVHWYLSDQGVCMHRKGTVDGTLIYVGLLTFKAYKDSRFFDGVKRNKLIF